MDLIILTSISPEDRTMVCTLVISVLALIYSLTMDRIPTRKFMKVHYMSLKGAVITNTIILAVLSVVVLLAARLWMIKISGVVVTILLSLLAIYIISLLIVSIEKIARTNTIAALLMCSIGNVWNIMPTPASIRACVFMIILTSIIPYAILVVLRIYNKANSILRTNNNDSNEKQSTSNSDAASISYMVFMFYVLLLLIMITSLHFAGGIFPNVWWFMTGSTDKNAGSQFTIFLCISLILSGLMTMSPPPNETLSSSREGSDTASILEGVLQASCVNNVVIGLITGIAFCTVA